MLRRSALRLCSIAVALAALCIPIPSGAPSVHAAPVTFRTSFTEGGITTTLSVPNRVYRWNALIAMRIRVDNHSTHPYGLLRTRLCDLHDFNLVTVADDGARRDSTTLHFPTYFCVNHPPTTDILPGHFAVRVESVVLRASRVQLNVGADGPLPIKLRLAVGGPPPTFSFSKTPNLHADITAAGTPSSPIMYEYVIRCHGGSRSADEAYWTVAPHGRIDAPPSVGPPIGCSWDIAAARLGYPVRQVHYQGPTQ